MKNQFFSPLIVMIISAWLGLAIPQAPAQSPVKVIETLTGQTSAAPTAESPNPVQTEALIKILEDDKARQQLLDQLRLLQQAVPKPQTTEAIVYEGIFAPFVEGVGQSLQGFSGQMADLLALFADLPKIIPWAQRKFGDDATLTRLGQSIGMMIIIAGAGILGVWFMRRLIRPIHQRLKKTQPQSWLAKAGCLGARWIMDMMLVTGFAAASFGVLSAVLVNRQSENLSMTLIQTVVMARIMMATARLITAPNRGGWRLNRLSDETAIYLDIWFRRLIYTGSYGYFICRLAQQLGLPGSAFEASIKLLGLVLTSMVVMLVLQNRQAIDDWLRFGPRKSDKSLGSNPDSSPSEKRQNLLIRGWIADLWHVFAILYVVALYLTWALQIKGGFVFLLTATAKTIALVLGARVINLGLRQLIQRGFRVDAKAAAAFPTLERRANRYMPMLLTATAFLVWLAAAIAVMAAWGIDSISWIKQTEARKALASLSRLGAILIGAVVLWEMIGSRIERGMNRLEEKNGVDCQRNARLRTLLPLLRTVSTVVLAVIVGLIVMAELGVNIAPLLAGAGIIGVAIGFGSQKLVQDIMTGLFMLIEDSMTVGDVIDLGVHAGVIEAINLRTLRLRDIYGTVHVVPYSEITTIKNLTREFAYAVMDIGVSYREDVDHVIRVIEETAKNLAQDDCYAADILEPLEVFGIDQFTDSAMIIKVRLKTRAMGQWSVRRAFNRLIKINFDREGIEMPYPHRTVYFGQMRDGTAPSAHIRMDSPIPDAP